MKILFLHNNFPAQYRWLARAVANDPKSEVVFGSRYARSSIPNVKNAFYKPTREPNNSIHPYLINAENAVLHGQAAYRMARELRKDGFVPNIICAHAGWGPAHFIKEVYPEAKLLTYFEWFYNPVNSDINFLPETTFNEDDYLRLRMKNTALLTDLNACDWGLTPTEWQWSQIPKVFRDNKISILHDGIHTDVMLPNPKTKLKINNLDLSDAKEIVTYVGRGMEPYRGFPHTMKAISILQKRRKDTHFVIVGDDRVAYGRQLPDGQSYKEKVLNDYDFDLSRLHFTGNIPYNDLITVFQASDIHIYLTIPFVLSWSMLEAMSAGCLVVASDTQPVTEIITDNENGLLVDFFNSEELADSVEKVLKNPDQYTEIRKNARKHIVEHYDYKKLLPQHIELINNLVSGVFPEQGGRYVSTIDKEKSKKS